MANNSMEFTQRHGSIDHPINRREQVLRRKELSRSTDMHNRGD